MSAESVAAWQEEVRRHYKSPPPAMNEAAQGGWSMAMAWVNENLQPLIGAEKAEAVREALDELIVAHGETFGASCFTSRMWLRERARQLREQP